MRKILSLLGATILSTTASASITACDNGDRPSTQKIDLNDVPSKVELTGVSKNIKSDFGIKLINKIKELKQEFSKLEKTDINITKVDGSTLQDSDIDNNPKLEIKISTFPNNKNFMGSKDIEVNLTVEKTNLSTITQLTGLRLVADNNKKFKDFNSKILQANEFLNKKATVDDYIINFYFDNKSNNLNETTQYPNDDIFVEIEATPSNPYWTGNTNLIQIEVFDS